MMQLGRSRMAHCWGFILLIRDNVAEVLRPGSCLCRILWLCPIDIGRCDFSNFAIENSPLTPAQIDLPYIKQPNHTKKHPQTECLHDSEIYNYFSTPVISYCDIAGCGGSDAWDSSFGTDGGGNIDADPLFKDADGPDDVAGTEDDNLQIAHESPCIDAGDSNSVPPDYADLDADGDTAERTPLDLAYNDRFSDDPGIANTGTGTPPIVDMGVYERYEFCGSGEYQSPPGDITGPNGVPDCDVNLYDFAVIALHWLEYLGSE